MRFRAALTPGLAAFRLRFEGVVFDSAALPLRPPRSCPWHLLLFVEDGSVLWNEKLQPAGSMLIAPEQVVLPSAPLATSLRTLGAASIVALRLPSWAVLGDHKHVRVIPTSACLHEAVSTIARLLDRDEREQPAELEQGLAALWHALRGDHHVAGRAPLALGDERLSRVEQRVSEALSFGLSQLEENPQLIDLLGHARVTERQMLRDIVAVQSRFGFVLRGWRDTLNWWRLVAATLFLGAPSLSVGDVARAVGFASTTTMARAFRSAGLPQPTSVRARLTSSPA